MNPLTRIDWEMLPGWTNFQDVYEDAVLRCRPGGTMVEVGTAFGKSAAMMAALLLEHQKTSVRFYAVDTWDEDLAVNTLSASASDDETPIVHQYVQRHGGMFAAFVKEMAMKAPGALRLIRPLRCDSARAARLFDDGSVDFVFIDAGHSLEAVTRDLQAWWPKIAPHGTFAGHDYLDERNPEVKPAVDRFFRFVNSYEQEPPLVDVEVIGTSWRARR